MECDKCFQPIERYKLSSHKETCTGLPEEILANRILDDSETRSQEEAKFRPPDQPVFITPGHEVVSSFSTSDQFKILHRTSTSVCIEWSGSAVAVCVRSPSFLWEGIAWTVYMKNNLLMYILLNECELGGKHTIYHLYTIL
eukprot:GHVH01004903.1.p1 GENE.GHVH01004903.1~~GHVH01004903.1.p1  ORF type:complete len:141 (-),score=16.74 GHVH01004903.1:198-620(-)